jgi:SAM-dependent methyltransferase
MSLGYRLAYQVGFTPWENAGRAAAQQLSGLLDREEADRTPPWGRALDLGCGTGMHTIELARRGWEATGVDAVGHAITKAQRRPDTHGAGFVVGDVTDLEATTIERGIEFFLDVGCFHGLDDHKRVAEGKGVTGLATPTATLLLLAFRPGGRPLLPRGADADDLARAFPGWQLLSVEPADTSGMPGPLKKTAPQWFRLRRISR